MSLTPEKIELAPDVMHEQIVPEWWDEAFFEHQPEPVYRIDMKGHRYYYTVSEEGEIEFFTSVTTLIKSTMPTPIGLLKWKMELGEREANRIANERSEYGTFMHKEIGRLLMEREYDLDQLRPALLEYIQQRDLPAYFISYEDDLKRDILSFAQFVIERNVRPLAIEIVLVDREGGYGGAIDVGCLLQWKGKDRVAIIDMKSGKKGFHEDNEIQLQAYKTMWDKHFPHQPAELIFNWSPKTWKGVVPTYTLKNQTDSVNRLKLPHLIALAKIEEEKRINEVTSYTGTINLDKGTSSNVNIIDLEAKVKALHDH